MSQRTTIFKMLNLLSEQLDRNSVVELIELYTTTSGSLLATLDQQAQKGDLPQLSKAAHALKSSSANLGATALSRLCQEVEKTKLFDASITPRLELIRRAHDDALDCMRAWRSE